MCWTHFLKSLRNHLAYSADALLPRVFFANLACTPDLGQVVLTVPSPFKEGGLVTAWSRRSINISYGWFLEQTLSAPQRWEHCQWLFIQMTNVFPPPACRHACSLKGIPSLQGTLQRHFQPLRDSEGLSQPAKGHGAS